MSIQKTMTPKHAPVCKVCKGTKVVMVKVKTADGEVEREKRCPACGATGKGKMLQK